MASGKGADIFVANDTGVQHGVVNLTAAENPATNAGPVQSFFDFLSGVFGGSSKPTSRLEIVGFNPQPEPPG